MSAQHALGPFAIVRESGAVVGPFTSREVDAFHDNHAFEVLEVLSGDEARAAIAKATVNE